jgi:hypothetical protein
MAEQDLTCSPRSHWNVEATESSSLSESLNESLGSQGMRGGWLGPPISKDKIGKMNDQAILAAISHYSANERPRGYRDFLKGGNLELARAIGAMAVKEPFRLGQLALRIPDNSAPEYLCELLRALEKASIDDALKLQVSSKAFAEHRESCGQEIANLLGAIEDPLPQDSLEQLSWLALYSSDPKEDLGKKETPGGTTYYDGDPHVQGINSVRGRAALAIGNLINRDPQYVGRFGQTLRKLTDERSEAVLTCIAFTLRALAVRDYEDAWRLFEQCCIHAPALPCSQYGFDLIRVGLRAHFDMLRPAIESLLRSKDRQAIEAGSQLACIAALTDPRAAKMAEVAVKGDDKQRFAAARVASVNLSVEEFRPWCEKQLLRFFDDSNKEVREEAGKCFTRLKGLPLENFAPLIEAYCRSAAFEDDSHSLLYTLEESVEELPGVVCAACELFLERFGLEARDIRTHRAADGYTVSKLIFRVYHQHQRDEWGSRTLDVIDRLCQEGVGEVVAQLQEFDR